MVSVIPGGPVWRGHHKTGRGKVMRTGMCFVGSLVLAAGTMASPVNVRELSQHVTTIDNTPATAADFGRLFGNEQARGGFAPGVGIDFCDCSGLAGETYWANGPAGQGADLGPYGGFLSMEFNRTAQNPGAPGAAGAVDVDQDGIDDRIDDDIDYTNLPNQRARAADDFHLQGDSFYRLDTIRIHVLTNTTALDPAVNNSFVEIYADCNGRPGERIFTSSDITGIVPTGIFYNNEQVVEFQFDASECFLKGKRSYWVSFGGVKYRASDVYYFATTGFDTNRGDAKAGVQGMQAHYYNETIFPSVGPWCPVDGAGNCPGSLGSDCRCIGEKTDLAFGICATEWDCLWDNGLRVVDLDGDGTPDVQELFAAQVNVAQPRFRVADDFQLIPCTDFEIALFEVGVYTTRDDCQTFVLELYETDPDTCLPYLEPLYIFADPEAIPSSITGTGVKLVQKPKGDITVLKNNFPVNLNIFHLQYQLPTVGSSADALVLEGGKTYWLAPFDAGAGAASNFAAPCFARRCDFPYGCNIQLNQAQVLRMPFDEWERVGDVIGDYYKRDIKFAVAGVNLGNDTLPDVVAPECNPADANGDGIVTVEDYFTFLTLFFNAL